MAADVGTLNRIQKIVGNDSWTREIAFTSRDVNADEAFRFGRWMCNYGVGFLTHIAVLGAKPRSCGNCELL